MGEQKDNVKKWVIIKTEDIRIWLTLKRTHNIVQNGLNII